MDPFFAAAIFVFGLVFGSFLNVCIYRLPRDKSVVFPGSACPGCGHPIRWYDNVPVFSWIVLRGRCRDCRERISPRYAIVESVVGILFVACYYQFGLSVATAKYCVFCFLLIGLIFTDAETRLLPDALTLPGLGLGLLFSFFVPMNDVVTEYFPHLWQYRSDGWRCHSLADALVGAFVGAFFIYAAGFAYKVVRGVEGMGLGDVKLMAMIGSFVGLRLTLLTVLSASLLGALFGLATIPAVWIKRSRRRMKRGHEPASVAIPRAWHSAKNVYRYYAMPFGVFLGSMALIGAFFGSDLYRWYLDRYL